MSGVLRVQLRIRGVAQLQVELCRLVVELGDVDGGPAQLAGGSGLVVEPVDADGVQAALAAADQAHAAPFGFVAASQAGVRFAPGSSSCRPVTGHK